jgi:4-amino-4-deoxy-L-arabinose transferase-like glycosyltransferase
MLALNCREAFVRKHPEPPTILLAIHTASDQTENPTVVAEIPRQKEFSLRWAQIAIVLVILLIAGIRFRLRDFPLERDEGEYAYAGQLILEGIPPYELAYNMKLPGTYAAYAAVMAVFGQTASGIHSGIIIVNAASIFLVFLITKKLFDPTAAVAAGAIFGLFTIRPILVGLAGHATHFVTLAALVSIYLLLKACGTDRYTLYFCSGICAGLALLMKQQGVFFAIFAGLYLCWSEWPGTAGRVQYVRKIAWFSAGAILPYLVTCLILLRAGVFQKFWFWTVSYARAYSSEMTLTQGLHHFANRMELQKEHLGMIWFLIVFGMAAFLWRREIKQHALFIIGLLAFSFLAVSVGLYYRGHYFIMAYPVLAMLSGVGLSSAQTLLAKLRWGVASAAVPATIFVLAYGNALYAERQAYFFDSPHEACRYTYGANPFPEALGVGNYIREHSAPDARIAVLGSEPEIYFYAHRLSATGYIYAYPLVEAQPYGRVMQAEMIKEIEAVKPEVLVCVMMNNSWIVDPQADRKILDWMEAYSKEHYTLEGVADGGNHDVYRWGPDAGEYRPRRPEFILVYRRHS